MLGVRSVRAAFSPSLRSLATARGAPAHIGLEPTWASANLPSLNVSEHEHGAPYCLSHL